MDKEYSARIERLSQRERVNRPAAGTSYFVRAMRLLLPLAAIFVVGALFIFNGMDDEDVIVPAAQKNAEIPREIVQNELTNPRFESRDKKSRPYEITAARAVQGKSNKDLIILEKPVGDMLVDADKKVHVTALSGAYRQDTERFYLDGAVSVEHSDGYVLHSEEAHLDLKDSLVWTEKPVTGKGPKLELQAQGLKADVKTGEITFKGPARIVLQEGFDGL